MRKQLPLALNLSTVVWGGMTIGGMNERLVRDPEAVTNSIWVWKGKKYEKILQRGGKHRACDLQYWRGRPHKGPARRRPGRTSRVLVGEQD